VIDLKMHSENMKLHYTNFGIDLQCQIFIEI